MTDSRLLALKSLAQDQLVGLPTTHPLHMNLNVWLELIEECERLRALNAILADSVAKNREEPP